MSYIDENLMRDETVVHRGETHWFVFVPTAITFVIGLFLAPVWIVTVILASRAAIQITTTELAVTSRRVIAKTGLIRRHTIELNHSKVESFSVQQSIFGRFLNYGSIVVSGTGTARSGWTGWPRTWAGRAGGC